MQHQTGLPPRLLMWFTAREPIRYLPPVRPKRWYRKQPFTGVAGFLECFEEPKPEDEQAAQAKADEMPPPPALTKEERRKRRGEERRKRGEEAAAEALKHWDPTKDPHISPESDALNTLFVGRLSYRVTEEALRSAFATYGPIVRVRVVRERKEPPTEAANGAADATTSADAATTEESKSRGYGFVEFETPEALKRAYRAADGKRIDGRPVVVDVERGRTVPGWKPMRLGGGLGGERRKARGMRGDGGEFEQGHPRFQPRHGEDDRDREGGAMVQHERSISRGWLLARFRAKAAVDRLSTPGPL